MEDREHAAAASIADLAARYARSDDLGWDTVMQEIQDRLRVWEIRPKRIGEVLSMAATGYLDGDARHAHMVLQLLVDAGADLLRAKVLRSQVPPRRVVGLGQTTLMQPPRAA